MRLMDDFETRLKTVRSQISAKSRLGGKLSYIAVHVDGLKFFPDDGTVEKDSNIVERSIRPIARYKKTRSSRVTMKAGAIGAASPLSSKLASCNNIVPYAYLKATMEAIAAGHPRARIYELMPCNFDKIA